MYVTVLVIILRTVAICAGKLLQKLIVKYNSAQNTLWQIL